MKNKLSFLFLLGTLAVAACQKQDCQNAMTLRFDYQFGGVPICFDRGGSAAEIPVFLWRCAARYAGYKFGKNYKRLPEALIMRWTQCPQ